MYHCWQKPTTAMRSSGIIRSRFLCSSPSQRAYIQVSSLPSSWLVFFWSLSSLWWCYGNSRCSPTPRPMVSLSWMTQPIPVYTHRHWGYTHIHTCASTYKLAWWCHGVLAASWTDSCAVMCSVLYQRYGEVQWIHTEVDVLIYLLYREILEKCQYHIIIVWKTGNIYWWL